MSEDNKKTDDAKQDPNLSITDDADKLIESLGYDDEIKGFDNKKFNKEKFEEFLESYSKDRRLELCRENILDAYDSIQKKPNLRNRDKLLSAGRIYQEIINEDSQSEEDKAEEAFKVKMEFDKSPAKPRDCLIEGVIANGTITILTGPGGKGKSRCGLQIASAVARGDKDAIPGMPQLNIKEEGEEVIYLTWEDDKDEIDRRLKRHPGLYNNDLAFENNFYFRLKDNFHCYDLANRGSLWKVIGYNYKTQSHINGFTALGKEVISMHETIKPRLLVIDVLAHAFMGNENNRSEVVEFMDTLNGLCRGTEMCVLLIAHPAKTADSDFSGSTSWHGSARCLLTLKNETDKDTKEDRLMLKMAKTNYFKPQKWKITDNMGYFNAVNMTDATPAPSNSQQQGNSSQPVGLHATPVKNPPKSMTSGLSMKGLINEYDDFNQSEQRINNTNATDKD